MKLTICSIITCILIADGREVGRVVYSPLTLGYFILFDSKSSGNLKNIARVLEKVSIIYAILTLGRIQLQMQM